MVTLGRNLEQRAAAMVSRNGALDGPARRIEEIAIGLAAQHRDTGDYIASIEIQTTGRRVRDKVVTATDPNALHIEFGHAVQRANGETYWEPGQYIFARTRMYLT